MMMCHTSMGMEDTLILSHSSYQCCEIEHKLLSQVVACGVLQLKHFCHSAISLQHFQHFIIIQGETLSTFHHHSGRLFNWENSERKIQTSYLRISIPSSCSQEQKYIPYTSIHRNLLSVMIWTIAEGYLESYQTSKKECFTKIVDSFQALTI